MATAQDHALLALARRQGHSLEASLLDDEALGSDPLAHRLLEAEALSGLVLTQLLRELAQGHFVCEGCAERIPYAFLSTLADLCCPLCACELSFVNQPLPRRRRSTLEQTLESLDERARALEQAFGQGEASPTVALPLELPPSTRWSTTQRPPEEAASPAPARGPSRERLPRRFAGLLLVRTLGSGANGVVYEARRPDGRTFALKLLHIGADDPEGLARFQQEAAVAQRIKHPGIVRVHAIGGRDGRYYCLMELVHGPTLRQHLSARRRLEPEEAIRLVAEIADAVAAAHAAGVVHRDLKPANVLLDERAGLPRLVDFGLACDRRREQALTQTPQLLGTPGYMAPEQLMGRRVTESVDVYALGVILYEALCGRIPHEAPSFLALANRVVHGAPRPPSSLVPALSPQLEQVVLRALRRAPAARYRDGAEFAEALRACSARA